MQSFELPLETRLKQIFNASRHQQHAAPANEPLCLKLTFRSSADLHKLHNDILTFMSQHGETTEDNLQLISGVVNPEDNSATIALCLPQFLEQSTATKTELKAATKAYLALLQDKRFQGNSALAGVTKITTPCRTTYKLKGYPRDYALM